MSKVPLTINGAEKLRTELHQLKTGERPSVIAAIAEARAHGDLSENAEYDAAKEGFTISGARNRLGESAILDQENGVELEQCKTTLRELRAEIAATLQVLRA